MNAPIVIVQKIRSVIPNFDREQAARKTVVRKPKAVFDKDLVAALDGIPLEILAAVAKELKL